MRRRLGCLLVCAWGSACVEYSWLYGDAGRDAGRVDATVDGARGDVSPTQDRVAARDGANDVTDARSEEDIVQAPMDAREDRVTTADIVDGAVVPRDSGMDVGCTVAGQRRCGVDCVNTDTDLTNCGSCGVSCRSGTVCDNGACVCPSGQTECGGRCVDLANDSMNCGRCSVACATTTGQTCMTGSCRCATGLTDCGAGICANVSSDPMNCGRCGTQCMGTGCVSGVCECPAGLLRCGSQCINPRIDQANCGRCGNPCPLGMVCSSGTCCSTGITCSTGGTGRSCCSGMSCRPYYPGRITTSNPNVCCVEAMHPCSRHGDCCGQIPCNMESGICTALDIGETCAANADCSSHNCMMTTTIFGTTTWQCAEASMRP